MKKMAQQRNLCIVKGKTFIQYTVVQQVLVKEQKLSSAEDREIKKLFLLYRDPYVITEVRDNNTVVIDEEKKMVTYNNQNIKPYMSSINHYQD
jgi:flagellar basal body rod protein FlgB